MKQQTYIVIINKDMMLVDHGKHYDFFRVGCKRISTVKKYVANWAKQATDGYGLNALYRRLFCYPGATYTIDDNDGNIVENGLIKDLCPGIKELNKNI